jgi:hypothetical protein
MPRWRAARQVSALPATGRPSQLYLIERREYVVGELDLGDGRHTHVREADAEADDPLLAQRRIEHAILPEALLQSDRAAEHAAELHVLAEENCNENNNEKKKKNRNKSGRCPLAFRFSLSAVLPLAPDPGIARGGKGEARLRLRQEDATISYQRRPYLPIIRPNVLVH